MCKENDLFMSDIKDSNTDSLYKEETEGEEVRSHCKVGLQDINCLLTDAT